MAGSTSGAMVFTASSERSLPSAVTASSLTSADASWRASISALCALGSPISPSARATTRRTSGTESCTLPISGTTARGSPMRPSARATSSRTSAAGSSRCPSSGDTASGIADTPIAAAAERRTCGSGSPSTRPRATTLRSVGAARITSHAARRRRGSASLSQAITWSPARGSRRAMAAWAPRSRTSASGSPIAFCARASPISGGSSAMRAAASRRSDGSPEASPRAT